jgi:ribonuclease BN (tRNA processing enzyme)
MPHTQVVLLGTGTPNADPDRMGCAVAIVVDDTPYLVDFGPGVVRRAAAAYRQGIAGLNVSRLNRAFLTHLHSDHTAGYADLILTPWVLGRKRPLQVFGPRGLKAMTEHLLAAYQADIHERINGLEPANSTGYQVKVQEMDPQMAEIYHDKNVTVTAFPVKHGSWDAFGFKFITADKTIVLSGDTAPNATIIQHADGCDILIHEVYSVQGFQKRPPDWQRYHAAVHTSAHELGRLAARAKPKLLVLVHQLFWGVSEAALLAEIREHYSGEVVSGKDLDVF